MNRVARPEILGLLLLASSIAGCAGATEPGDGTDTPPPDSATIIAVSVHTAERTPISSYIYGSNQDDASDVWTVRRFGGNRITGYNWETNDSNAGSDYLHNSDLFAITNAGIPIGEAAVPARALTWFHDQSLAMGAESIVSLQMAGYVAADADGPVSVAETAPSPRWVAVVPRKSAPFTATPDPDDDAVYMDELVDLLVDRYGGATSPRGVRWYSLDNEPALWAHTHPRIHPDPVGARELIQRSVALAEAVKARDPASEILGPALYGMSAFVSLQDAPDWESVRQGRRWFIDYYLEEMRLAGEKAGTRLLDVLDVHWYPEARGDHRIIAADATTARDAAARIQAPRSLWDATYREESWIQQVLPQFLPLLPQLRSSIEQSYPGTQLALTEYNFGGGNTISGGLAQADVLGIFGRERVYLATLWGIGSTDRYTSAAFKLFRDYDGQRGAFGSTGVATASNDPARASTYGAIEEADAAKLHLILLNKDAADTLTFRIQIESDVQYATGAAWGFDALSSQITSRTGVARIQGNRFDYSVAPLTAIHLVLR